ncbi:BatA domain-containing protein [Spirosoma fluminis]
MQFVEPYLLWGALAVAIPVVIHFWHQKRGKLLPWAATQWLTEKDQQQSRGLRLDNIALLIVRCLLLLLVALLLSQPVLHWFDQSKASQRIHLVQPSTLVANNFKFELDEAQKKGESVYWIHDQLPVYTTPLSSLANSTQFNALTLQTAINQLPSETTELHTYLVNDQELADLPAITVPATFQLHSVPDSTTPARPYLAVRANKKLFVNRAGKLTSNETLDPTVKFRPTPALTGSVRVLLSYRNLRERQTVKAALAALSDVYALDLIIDERPAPNQAYNWVLTDQTALANRTAPQTLYIVSGPDQAVATNNVIYTNETLTPQTSERVASGQLPEWLGQQFIQQYVLNPTHQPLSQSALNALFIPSPKRNVTQQAGIQQALLLLLTVLLVLERWLALTKNA